jgi:hypothetical protein
MWAEQHEPARLHAAEATAKTEQASAKAAETAKQETERAANGPKATALAASVRGAAGGLQSVIGEFQHARAQGKVPETALGALGKAVFDALRSGLEPACGGPEGARALALACELSKPETAEALSERVRHLGDQIQSTVLAKANAAGEALGAAPDAGHLAALAEQAARTALSKALAEHSQGEKPKEMGAAPPGRRSSWHQG